jgi:methylmalonyl-CoA mutase N-terminal domain/subunit
MLKAQFEEAAIQNQKEVDSGDKLIVGANIFTSEPETETPLGVQRISGESASQQIADCTKLKETRDYEKVSEAIKRLQEEAQENRNTIPAMIEATKALATTAELIGTVREVYGYSYDPMNIIESPFSFSPGGKKAVA